MMQANSPKRRLDMGQIEVVDEPVAAILRTKTPAERLAMAFDANRTARVMLGSVIRAQHPDWTDEQVQREVARRLMRGPDCAAGTGSGSCCKMTNSDDNAEIGTP